METLIETLLNLNEKVKGGYAFTNELNNEQVINGLPATKTTAIRRAEKTGRKAALFITPGFTVKVVYKVDGEWTSATNFADLLVKGYKFMGYTHDGQDKMLLNYEDALIADLNLTEGTLHGKSQDLAYHGIELMGVN